MHGGRNGRRGARRDCGTIAGLLRDSRSKVEIWCQSEPFFPAKLAPEVSNPGAGNQCLFPISPTASDCFPHCGTASKLLPLVRAFELVTTVNLFSF
jgi:hypothetical protein